jgi:hypothetical protein
LSWAAHDLEPYLLRAKLGGRISLLFCLAGSYSPDIFTKWAVYGFGFYHHDAILSNPVQFHRGWPGAGITHTPFYGVAVAGLIFAFTRNRLWAISFLIGAIAHVLSDTLDSVGIMLLFPFSTWHLHFDLWEYGGEIGRGKDAVAYYTSLGGVWDVFWAVWLLRYWRMFSTRYFRAEIVPTDPLWIWMQRYTGETVMLTAYRSSAFFGYASIIGWYIWALFVNTFHPHLDLHPGGPHWLPRQGPE